MFAQHYAITLISLFFFFFFKAAGLVLAFPPSVKSTVQTATKLRQPAAWPSARASQTLWARVPVNMHELLLAIHYTEDICGRGFSCRDCACEAKDFSIFKRKSCCDLDEKASSMLHQGQVNLSPFGFKKCSDRSPAQTGLSPAS